MKKQINPTIKAHLIRSALFLLLLLAVCAIASALAQRNYRAIGTRFSNANAVTLAAQHPPSALAAPVDRKRVAGVLPKKRIAGPSPLGLLGTTGYSQDAAFAFYTVFDLGVPEVLPNIAPFDAGGNFIGAGEFVNGSVYMIDTSFTMYQVEPLTGTLLSTIPVTPPGGSQSYTGMTLDPTTGDVYLASCDITTSRLFSFDVATGQATLIGTISNSPCTIDIAIDGSGQMYGYDIVNDSFMSIDKATAAGTILFPLGFDANFGQGMAWVPATDQIILAAFNNVTFQAEERFVDFANQTTVLLGVLGQTDPGGVNQLGFLAVELLGGATPTPTPTGTPSPTPTATASPTCTPGGGTPGPWTQGAPVAVDHYGGFMDSDGTFGYEGGGYSFSVGDNINNFARFDPAANTWTPLAAVPDLNNSLASGVYAPNVNKLFVFGGENVNAVVVVNTTRIYDIATNTWSTGASMPDVRAFMASGYFNGKIYLVGGYSTGNVDPSFGQVWEYDPVANTFDTSRTDMPATLGGPGFGVINGHLYVAGGRDINNTNLNTLYDYDIAADSWTQRANLPSGQNVPASAVIGGKLWIFGGGNPFEGSAAIPSAGKQGVRVPDTTNILQVYDPATDSWTTGPSLSQIRSFPAGTDVGNTAVAVGGYTGTDTTTSVEINVTSGGDCSPTPTPTATAPTATPTATATGTAPSATPTATATATATATPTSTARPTPTPRAKSTPRPAPTPGPRPTIKPSPWPPPSPTP